MTKENVITRIAPSPTGLLHVGTARSALFNFLFARNHGGTFIVRMEDTDKERSTKEFDDNIIEGLKLLGLSYDDLYRQSERTDIYKKYITKLLENDSAYLSKEESKKNPGETVEVVRLRNPGKKITFNDMIRGDITFDTTDLEDFVIARNINEPLYHLAVVVDDFEMKITHVIRGEDHISNTPRQILIQEALGFERPIYAHIPLILAPDRSKLSKRKGAVAVSEYMTEYLPEAFINYLALLGWNPGTEQEIFSLDELIEVFDITKVQKGGAIFNTEKLGSINHEHIKKMSPEDFQKYALPLLPKYKDNFAELKEPVLNSVLKEIQERAHNSTEIKEVNDQGDLDFYFTAPEYSAEAIVWKNETPETTKEFITTIIKSIDEIDEKNFNKDSIKNSVWDYAGEKGRGSVLWPMRFALTGREKSPDPFTVAEILGKGETVKRLQTAITKL